MSEEEKIPQSDESGTKKDKFKLKYLIPVIILLLAVVIFAIVKFGGEGFKNAYVPGNANGGVTPHITYVTQNNDNVTDDKSDLQVPDATEAPSTTPTQTPVPVTVTPTSTVTKVPTKATEQEKPVNTPVPSPSIVSGGGSTGGNGTPVSIHGALSVKGTQLVDKNGNAFQLKGVSTHGLQWFPQYVNKDAFKSLRDEWGCNVVRLALYTHEGGYCSGGDKTALKKLVTDGVSYATDLGMYVIIDWHVLQEQNPDTYKSEAKTFFDEMSKKYSSYDNVIYEICNEPNGSVTWDQVKSYSKDIISVIRANDKDAIIIVGTPTWSQDVDKAAASPITGYSNIMYALHYYADTHTDWLRDRMVNAINAGLPIFVSEFGICDASGNGACNISQANSWVETMDKYGVSYVCWNLANKNESSSLITNGNSKTSGWSYDDLSTEGKWLVDTLGGSIAKYTSGAKKSTTGGNSGGGSTGGNSGGGSTGGNTAQNTPTPVITKTPSISNTPTPTKATSSGDVTVSANMVNSWSNGGTDVFYQYSLSIKNNMSSDINDWTVTVTYSGNLSKVEGWNAQYTISGKTLTIKPVEDWAKKIQAGNEKSDVGFTITASEGVSITSVKITY